MNDYRTKWFEMAVATGRGVADRYRAQYCRDGKWGRTVNGDCEATYNKLCDLGPIPPVDAVAEVIGNKSWTHLSCISCNEHVERAAHFPRSYSEEQIFLCETCLRDAVRVFD